MNATSTSLITEQQRQQFRDEGWFLLPGFVPHQQNPETHDLEGYLGRRSGRSSDRTCG